MAFWTYFWASPFSLFDSDTKVFSSIPENAIVTTTANVYNQSSGDSPYDLMIHLVSVSLRDGKEIWKLATPEAQPGFFPRMEDRILGRSTTAVHEGIIYRRRGTKLWAYTDREVKE